jgi:hypothetical protein
MPKRKAVHSARCVPHNGSMLVKILEDVPSPRGSVSSNVLHASCLAGAQRLGREDAEAARHVHFFFPRADDRSDPLRPRMLLRSDVRRTNRHRNRLNPTPVLAETSAITFRNRTAPLDPVKPRRSADRNAAVGLDGACASPVWALA